MKEENSLLYEDAVHTVLYRLGAIQNTLDTLILGMKAEQLEEQAVCCLECIKFCLHDLQTYMSEIIKQESEGCIRQKA